MFKSRWLHVFAVFMVSLLGFMTFAQVEGQNEREIKAADGANHVPFYLSPPRSVLTDRAVIYSSDFEANDGGWISGGAGDWEWGPVVAGIYNNCFNVGGPEPAAAFSGVNCWGTILDDCHTGPGAVSTLTQTFDFSGLTGAMELSFQTWYHVFGDWDYIEIFANGTQLWIYDGSDPTADWGPQIVDLSAYAGNPSVEIQFSLYASTVVNYRGWYLDDVEIATGGGAAAIPTMGTTALIVFAVLLGTLGVVIMGRRRQRA